MLHPITFSIPKEKICENYNFMNDPIFFISMGLDFFEYRIYMKPISNIISGLLYSKKTLEFASRNKNIFMLEWMYNNYCKSKKIYGECIIDYDLINYDEMWTSKVFENAVFNNDIVMLEWFKYNIYYYEEYEDIVYYAVKNENFCLVEWLLIEEFPINERTSIPAIQNGNIKMLKLLQKYNCPENSKRHHIAIFYGQFDMLKYIYFKNPEIFQNDKLYINNLIIKNNEDTIIKWLYSKNIIN